MDAEVLKAERRAGRGTSAAQKLRRTGKVPAVLYGHGEEVVALTVSAVGVHEFLASGHHVVTLDVEGATEQALIKDIQFDTWGRAVLHVDFSRVALDETVTVSVDVVGHGTPKATLSGAVLEQPLRSLEVVCTADAIPDQITVEVGELDTGEMIHVRDIEMPPGVQAQNDPGATVFVVHEARQIEEAPAEEEAAAEAGPAEPEVIGRAAKAESGEAEEPEEKKT